MWNHHLRRSFGCLSNLIVSLSAVLFQRSLDNFYPSFTHKILYSFYKKTCYTYYMYPSIHAIVWFGINAYIMCIHLQYMLFLQVISGMWKLCPKKHMCVYIYIYIDYMYIHMYIEQNTGICWFTFAYVVCTYILRVDVYNTHWYMCTCIYWRSPRPWCCFASDYQVWISVGPGPLRQVTNNAVDIFLQEPPLQGWEQWKKCLKVRRGWRWDGRGPHLVMSVGIWPIHRGCLIW